MRLSRLLYAIGIILFAYIVYSTGPEKILGSLARLNPLLFLLVLAFNAPLIALKALKQNILMRAFGAKIPLFESAKIWLIGYFLSIITPGRSGDFLRSVYLSKQTGVPAGKCLTAVVAERILDLCCLFVLGIAGLAILSARFSIQQSALLTLAALFAAFCAGMPLLANKKAAAFIAKPLLALAPEGWRKKLRAGFHGFYEGLREYGKNKRALLYASVLTAINWSVSIFQYYLLAVALGLSLSPAFLIIAMPVVLLAEALPISISGIGTRDAAVIFLFSFGGVQAADAVSFSVALLSTNFAVAFFGLLAARQKKVRI